MDLLSSIRKSGSRGGVNFSWDEVQTSQHRENYLGHSLMAPVGRWQKGRDLNWYAKADDEDTKDGETVEEKKIRQRKEEIKRIKEAEEDALSRALGLPVPDRSGGGVGTGSNAIGVGELKRVIKETEFGDEETEEMGRGTGFGTFVGKVAEGEIKGDDTELEKGGLLGEAGKREKKNKEGRSDSRERRRRRHRHRSRSGERDRHRSRSWDRHRHRERTGERYQHIPKHEDRGASRERIRSPGTRERKCRSRSPDRRHSGREDRGLRRDVRDDYRRRRRSQSPSYRRAER